MRTLARITAPAITQRGLVSSLSLSGRRTLVPADHALLDALIAGGLARRRFRPHWSADPTAASIVFSLRHLERLPVRAAALNRLGASDRGHQKQCGDDESTHHQKATTEVAA